jgi:acetyl esterase
VAAKPEVQTFLDLLAQMESGSPEEPGVDETRETYRGLYAMTARDDGAEVSDRTFPGPAGDVALRVYRPSGSDATPPLLVWFHGGGWTIGDLDTTDGMARALCTRGRVVVASVDYRLAPEHPFPAAVDDCMEATAWLSAHADELGADGSRLAVGGHSAGGNLAAVVSQLAKSIGGPSIALQVLCCPVTDASRSWPSRTENGEGKMLTQELMDWFTGNYLAGNDAAAAHPRVSPLLTTDLSGLPPAAVITAELDPLRDEGNAYVEALQAAGVPVDHRLFEGEIHDFYTLQGILPDAEEALDHLAKALAETLR